MTNLELRVSEMYERALACLIAQFADIPANSDGAEAAAGLRVALANIQQESSSQAGFDGTAKSGTIQRTFARDAIKEYLKTAAKTADVVAHKNPGFDDNFPMPYRKNDEQLLATARAVSSAVKQNKEDFIRLGLTEEYLNSIDDKIESFADALHVTNTALSNRGAAVGQKKTGFEIAEDHFALLNMFIFNHYRDQPQKLSAWRITSHVERRAKSNADKPKPPIV